MNHPRFADILEQLELLQPKHDLENTTYATKYDFTLDLVLKKVITDVYALINTPVEEFPAEIDITIALLASNFIETLGLINTPEETEAENAKTGGGQVQSLSEGDTSVTYTTATTTKASTLTEALAANTITGDYKSTLLHWRRLAT